MEDGAYRVKFALGTDGLIYGRCDGLPNTYGAETIEAVISHMQKELAKTIAEPKQASPNRPSP